MEIKVRVQLQNADGTPRSGGAVELCFYQMNGQPRTVAKGVSGPDGRVEMAVTETLPTVQPRLLLRMRSGRVYRALGEAPVAYTESLIDFGTITVSDTPALKVGSVDFYGANWTAETQPAAAVAKPAVSGPAAGVEDASLVLLRQQVADRDTQITTLQRDATSLRTANEALQAQAQTLNAQNQSLTGRNQTLERDLGARNAELEKIRQEAAQLTAARDALTTRNQTLERDLTARNADLDKARQEVTRVTAARDALTTRNQTLERDLGARNAELDKVRQEATQTAAAKDAEIRGLRDELAGLHKKYGADTNLQDLFTDTARQIEAASRRLAEERVGYRLGKVSMQMKVMPGTGGTGVSFLRREEAASAMADALSTIALEFTPDQPGRAADTAVPVPDVVGYTRQMATRKLLAAGFTAEFRDELVTEPAQGPGKAGRTLRQVPAAGTRAEPGSAVVLTLGRTA